MQSDDAPNGLGNLVGFQANVNPERGQMPYKSCKDAQGDRQHPKENVVRQHEHLRISASAKHTLGHNAVGCLEYHDQTDCIHQLRCHVCRTFTKLEVSNNGTAHQDDKGCGNKSQR